MKIGIDIDEVLADHINLMMEFHNQVYGTSLKKEDVSDYGLWHVWGCSEKEAVDRVHDFFNSAYAKKIKPMPGAVEGIEQLNKKHDLVAVTARPYELTNYTKNWLKTYFPDKFPQIYFVNHWNKNNLPSLKKSEVCLKLGIKVFVDDHLA